MSPEPDALICGAGVSGSYLARLLVEGGFRVEVYDGNPLRGHRCAYISFSSLLKPILRRIGLELDDFILCHIRSLHLNGVELEVRNMISIDKPRMIEEIYPGDGVIKKNLRIPEELFRRGGEGTLTVNASSRILGAQRRILPRQFRARASGLEAGEAYLSVKPGYGGYSWAFPLDEEGRRFHIGAGCVNADPQPLIDRLMRSNGIRVEETICSCGRAISVADLSRNPEIMIHRGMVASIGEAAGAVFPMTGEGIIPSLETANWLYESLDRGDYPQSFEAKVQGMLMEYRDAFNLCIGFLKHPRLTWLRGVGRMTERLKGRALLNLTPVAWMRLWLKMLARG
ncbi:hypothetical protein KEJ49_04540 [Candidatus Bathyarchaeota archaeon]|nr:hypothetical protein [Candidatus Bathyarchaeota archaeon]